MRRSKYRFRKGILIGLLKGILKGMNESSIKGGMGLSQYGYKYLKWGGGISNYKYSYINCNPSY